MVVEARDNLRLTFKKDPKTAFAGGRTWSEVPVVEGEPLPVIELGKGYKATINSLAGSDLLKLERGDFFFGVIVVDEEINDPNAVWAGRIRRV